MHILKNILWKSFLWLGNKVFKKINIFQLFIQNFEQLISERQVF